MKNSYIDIRTRIHDEEPSWWDEHGVPRYCDFSPKAVANIYADECALILIACQNCGRTFKVAMSWDWQGTGPSPLLVHYGDPPNVGCCPAGPTMNCNDLKILEWWTNEGPDDARLPPGWARKPKNEVLLPDHPEFKEKT